MGQFFTVLFHFFTCSAWSPSGTRKCRLRHSRIHWDHKDRDRDDESFLKWNGRTPGGKRILIFTSAFFHIGQCMWRMVQADGHVTLYGVVVNFALKQRVLCRLSLFPGTLSLVCLMTSWMKITSRNPWPLLWSNKVKLLKLLPRKTCGKESSEEGATFPN